MNRHHFPSTLFLLLPALHCLGADPQVDPADLPHTPPTPPAQALETFALKQGFRLELAVAEPQVRDPIELCFDENGRLFVVEMIDYSERRGETPHLGRIRMLEDSDDDGRYDRSRVFAEDLPWPTAVIAWDEGLFVAATPDILYLKDTDADGRADLREVVFTGFANDYAPYATNQLNVQAMLNSLRWGLDNRIHGVTSMNGGRVRSLATPDTPTLNLRGRDFAFDPRTRTLSAEAGGGQYGQCFDDAGNRFTCSNSDHIRVFMYDTRYAERNPAARLPAALQSIAVDGPAAEVYRTSPDEPWRVIRTRWRVSGAVPGIVEGGGRPSGYFTSATGLTVYRGDAFPAEYRGDVFIADCGSNLIHRKKVRRDGVRFLAERPADEQTSEFLTSTDLWFRPVQMANAPDGTLWILDMYREIIEHPWSLPPALKQHLDLNAGNDRGRLYRIIPEAFKPRPRPRLGHATTERLVTLLAHPNAWHRETASRLLYERQDRATAVPALQGLLKSSTTALGRLHALYALQGQQALTPTHVRQSLSDPDETVRVHAIRLAESLLRSAALTNGVSRWTKKLGDLIEDPSPRVRFQLAWTLGEIPVSYRVPLLKSLLMRDMESPWIRSAALNAAGDGAPRLFESLAQHWESHTEAHGSSRASAQVACLEELAGILAAANNPTTLHTALQIADGMLDTPLALGVLQAITQSRPRSAAPLPRNWVRPFTDRALTVVTNRSLTTPERVRAVSVLGLAEFDETGGTLLELLAPIESVAIRLAVIETLGRLSDPAIGPGITARWRRLTPRVRNAATAMLLARPERALALLTALQAGVIRASELDSNQIRFLKSHSNPTVKTMAEQLLAVSTDTEREALLQSFQPALNMDGDPSRGRTLFNDRCVSCHRLGGEGHAVGPDLVSVRNNGRAKMLMNIIDPSRELLPQYIAYEVETVDGESLLGLLAEETAAAVVLRQAYGTDTRLPRSDITDMSSSRKSMMPDGLETGMDAQAMADLLEFVFTAE